MALQPPTSFTPKLCMQQRRVCNCLQLYIKKKQKQKKSLNIQNYMTRRKPRVSAISKGGMIAWVRKQSIYFSCKRLWGVGMGGGVLRVQDWLGSRAQAQCTDQGRGRRWDRGSTVGLNCDTWGLLCRFVRNRQTFFRPFPGTAVASGWTEVTRQPLLSRCHHRSSAESSGNPLKCLPGHRKE